MKVITHGLMLVLITPLVACGGGGSNNSVGEAPAAAGGNPDDGVGAPAPDPVLLSQTIAGDGLLASTTQSLVGEDVTFRITPEFGIEIDTGGGLALDFAEQNRTFFGVFTGYSSDDESDLVIAALPGDGGVGLDYATFGYWAESDDPGLIDGDAPADDGGAFFAGNLTPESQMPTLGTAVYTGRAVGHESSSGGPAAGLIVGNAAFTADFSNNLMTGTLAMRDAEGFPIVTVSIPDAVIDSNGFGGRAVSNRAHNGTVDGGFFGPSASEVAGFAELDGPSRLQIGFGGTQ